MNWIKMRNDEFSLDESEMWECCQEDFKKFVWDIVEKWNRKTHFKIYVQEKEWKQTHTNVEKW